MNQFEKFHRMMTPPTLTIYLRVSRTADKPTVAAIFQDQTLAIVNQWREADVSKLASSVARWVKLKYSGPVTILVEPQGLGSAAHDKLGAAVARSGRPDTVVTYPKSGDKQLAVFRTIGMMAANL